MRVLYDISYLGHGFRNATQRTGIFRVTESLALALNNIDGCDLTFFAPNDNLSDVRAYLQAQQTFRDPPFLGDMSVGLFEFLETGLRNHKYMVSLKSRMRPSIAHRSLEGALGLGSSIFHALRMISSDYRYQRRYPEYDIYHYLYYWPKLKYRARPEVRFQTVYDLVPVLFPQFIPQKNQVEDFAEKISDLDSQDYVLCISNSTRDDLLSFNKRIDPERCFVTPLAASSIFQPCRDKDAIARVKKRYNIPASAPYILSLCTLEPRKNLLAVVRSFKHLSSSRRIDDLHLALVGPYGWDNEALISEVGETETAERRIVLTGFVADEDLSALYSGATGFIYVPIYEGFGLPPLEAMQCGTPVITSNTSSIPEVVGDAALLVDPKDEEAISQAILSLYLDSSVRSHYSKLGLAQARGFSWEKCAELTFDAYRAALDDR